MSKKQFSSLLILTLAIAAIIIFIPVKTGNESDFEAQRLVPGMNDWVNEVDRVRLVKAGNEAVATLARREKAWVVEEAHSYPADWNRLRTLLADLAQAEVIEAKTSNAEYFHRLGLVDVSDESSKALLVELENGGQAIRIMIGNSAQEREGHYVRMADADQAFLVDQVLDVADSAKDWLKRDVVDISDSEIVEVRLNHADGEQLVLQKHSADDQDFELLNIPEGREVQSSWTVNSIAGSLSMLRLDEVDLESNIDWDGASALQFLTADGLQVSVDVVSIEEKHWIKLRASVHPDMQEENTPESGEPDSVEFEEDATDEGEQETESDDSPVEPDASLRADEINQRVAGWAYAIPQNKAQNLKKRLEDLLKPLSESE